MRDLNSKSINEQVKKLLRVNKEVLSFSNYASFSKPGLMVHTKIPALKKQMKKGSEFKANRGYIEEVYLERKLKTKRG